MGIFDGKVIVITGAGGGIGRSHALAFAAEGAKVVVNDLGTAPDGTGSTISMADKVVEEIKQLGGEATANYDSVTTMNGGENIVKTAIDTYDKIDILINNAGILRDKTIINMEEKNWDAVLDVHLKGTFTCTQAAARVMKKQGTGGSIINTSSLAGLMGNFGQSNYGSAKAGICGFTRVAALELIRYGITVNCISPMAKTRLTEGIDAIPDEFTPEQATPIVLFLASDKAKDITGRIFGIHGQHLFEFQMITTPGVEKKNNELWTIDEIAEKLEEITRMPVEEVTEEKVSAELIEELFKIMPQAFSPEKAKGWSSVLHFNFAGVDDWCVMIQDGRASTSKEIPTEKNCVIKMSAETMMGLISGEIDPTKAFMGGDITASNMHELVNFNSAFSFKKIRELLDLTTSDSSTPVAESTADSETGLDPRILGKIYTGKSELITPEKIIAYAKATNETNPRYYEEEEDNLLVPPIFPVTTLIDPMQQIVTDDTLNLDIMRMVHGEQEILYHRLLKPGNIVESKVELESIDSKQSGDILWAKMIGTVDGDLVYEMRAGLFFRKPRKEKVSTATVKIKTEPIKGEVIVSSQMTVDPDQSARYAEASGDHNPIHLDSDVAQAFGLPDKILHGLCTMAFATQAIVDGLEVDPSKVKRVRTRFTKPVLMNEILTTEGWLIEENISKVIGFETKNQDGKAVLTRGEVEILK
ncbi:MAG: SDR family NAD(P)-dependent oxidoreductase [Candidatus Hodarchaeales archaeon]|jgi:NAD(P)-dependent dehydrogenase (short-subunit alcohol dehydrogenase family)/acyl dehydratase/putative sterol carrier protein